MNIAIRTFIEDWARIRPKQHPQLDRRTGEMVNFLFQVRNRTLDSRIVNNTLIPVLCAKAGVSMEDSRGRITSHRGLGVGGHCIGKRPERHDFDRGCGVVRSPQPAVDDALYSASSRLDLPVLSRRLISWRT